MVLHIFNFCYLIYSLKPILIKKKDNLKTPFFYSYKNKNIKCKNRLIINEKRLPKIGNLLNNIKCLNYFKLSNNFSATNSDDAGF